MDEQRNDTQQPYLRPAASFLDEQNETEQAPQAEEKISEVEEALPIEEEETPEVEEALPIEEEEIPVVEEALPVEEEEIPVVEEALPIDEEEIPEVEEALPIEEEEIPEVEETLSIDEEEIPEVEEALPIEEEETPEIEEALPIEEEETPEVEEALPIEEEEIPVIEETLPIEEEEIPEVEEALPVEEEETPETEENTDDEETPAIVPIPTEESEEAPAEESELFNAGVIAGAAALSVQAMHEAAAKEKIPSPSELNDELPDTPLELPKVGFTEAPQEPAPQPAQFYAPVPPAPAYDPLTNRQSLPNLFPHEAPPAPPAPAQPPTIVPRPKRKKNKTWRIVRRILISAVKWIFALILAAAIVVGGLLGYLTMTEYSPAYAEKAQLGNNQVTAVCNTDRLRILTLNTGFGGLGADADFFMDGGDGVTPESKQLVQSNMSGIERILSDSDADIILLQEVDTDSKRSYNINQWLQYENSLERYESRFALNYSCKFVPYPLFDFIGKVNSGIATYSRYDISSATRYSLPCPFKWPVRVANLKRCLLVTRIPLDKPEVNGHKPELVIVNLHLEAYDDGEGKKAQTEQLMKLLQEEYAKGNYVIAGGDFNQNFPNCDAYPILNDQYFQPGQLDKLPAGWKYAYDEAVPTSRLLNEPYRRKTAQFYVIDGFIVSPNVTIHEVETIDADFTYTDHNPVMIEIELK